jgi:hypothetical protein
MKIITINKIIIILHYEKNYRRRTGSSQDCMDTVFGNKKRLDPL